MRFLLPCEARPQNSVRCSQTTESPTSRVSLFSSVTLLSTWKRLNVMTLSIWGNRRRSGFIPDRYEVAFKCYSGRNIVLQTVRVGECSRLGRGRSCAANRWLNYAGRHKPINVSFHGLYDCHSWFLSLWIYGCWLEDDTLRMLRNTEERTSYCTFHKISVWTAFWHIIQAKRARLPLYLGCHHNIIEKGIMNGNEIL